MKDQTPLGWRGLSPAELAREYSPSSAVGGNYRPFVDAYAARSRAARAACRDVKTLRYGPAAANLIDIVSAWDCGAATGAPLLAFIHGGYWQEGSRTDSLYGADYFASRGIGYAAIGYTLAPCAGIADIVAECRLALAQLVCDADRLGIDPRRIVLAGSSAGAQLAAMCCAADGPSALAGLVLLSGIYELEPLVGTYINDPLGMGVAEAHRHSPMRRELSGFPATIVSWGEVETRQFKRQSQQFAARLRAAGVDIEAFESPLRNHFDIVHDMADAKTRLGRSLLAMLRRR